MGFIIYYRSIEIYECVFFYSVADRRVCSGLAWLGLTVKHGVLRAVPMLRRRIQDRGPSCMGAQPPLSTWSSTIPYQQCLGWWPTLASPSGVEIGQTIIYSHFINNGNWKYILIYTSSIVGNKVVKILYVSHLCWCGRYLSIMEKKQGNTFWLMNYTRSSNPGFMNSWMLWSHS
jgi:hypothetical protein